MSSFDTSEMAAALPEATNGNAPGPNVLSADQLREKGWVEPKSYDYDAAMASHSKVTGTTAGEPASGSGGEDQPGWAHNAAKYEWQDDFGDVGPRVPELELQLFQDQNLTRRGGKFDT